MRYLFWTLCISLIGAQVRIGDWRAFTSPLKIHQIINTDNHIVSATEGGLFIFNEKNSYTLTTIEGLKGVGLGALAQDSSGNTWIGGSFPFGFIQIYDLDEQRSIDEFDFGLSTIFGFEILDSLVFAWFQDGQDMGIMKFVYNQEWQYRDSYKNFPAIMGSINCFSISNSKIILGTDSGLWIGDYNTNLKDPNNWVRPFQNLMIPITSMQKFGVSILISTVESLLVIDPLEMSTTPYEHSFTSLSFDKMINDKQGWWFSKGKTLFRLDLDGRSTEFLFNHTISYLHTNETNGLIIGSDKGFFLLPEISVDLSNQSFKHFIPNAPVTSGFSAITVLDDGRLVGGSSNGLSILDKKGWRNILEIKIADSDVINSVYDYSNFLADTVPYDFGGYIADLEQGPDGLVYCSIRGSRVYQGNPPRRSGGIIIVDVDNPENITIIDTTYLSYHTTSANSIPYLVVLDIEFDTYGNMWVADPYAINGNNPLHVRSSSGIWKHFGSSETATKISQSPNSITFDSWNRTWFSAFQAEEANLGIYPNGGLFMLVYDGPAYNPESFYWEKVISDGTIRSLAMGSQDRLYYLTPSGLNYFDLKNGANPIIRENPYPYFPNISFGDGAELKVDHQGNIWAHSPTQGVHILLENTTYWPNINGFRTSNSPLLSDEITDIDFDSKNNLAYIATSKGVNIVRIPFGIEKTDYSRLKVYPSPFYIPSQKPMKVDNLPFGSSMIIMTLDGSVVKKVSNDGLSVDGDQISWDGRDKDGEYVSSGVYLLGIYGMDGEKIIEKITVIRN